MEIKKMVYIVKAFCYLYGMDKDFLEYETVYIFNDANLKVVENKIIENLKEEIDYKDKYYVLITEIVDLVAQSSIIFKKSEKIIKNEIKDLISKYKLVS